MINPLRHTFLFDPREWGREPIAIIGCGGLGSHVAWLLARLGIERMVLFDGDVLADHNIANQCYALRDIGRPKALALAEALNRDLGTNAFPMVRRVESACRLPQVVFVCVDSMAARKAIMEDCIFNSPGVRFVVDIRMDSSYAVVLAFNPNDARHVALWKHYWFPDAEAENAGDGCGGKVSVCYTAQFAASFAVHEFLRWARTNPRGSDTIHKRSFNLDTQVVDVEKW